jgi:hypothetical protein
MGALVAGTGSVAFAVGDRRGTSSLETAGAVSLMCGLAAILGAGVWVASRSSCDVDTDCPETEVCQHLPTTVGPYGHCVAR